MYLKKKNLSPSLSLSVYSYYCMIILNCSVVWVKVKFSIF